MSYKEFHDIITESFTKENLDLYFRELAKEFRKLNGKKMPAEITLIGGAAILAKYGFRDLTNDVDALITASSAMKDAINRVSDKYNLPSGWLNADFQRTKSYSQKLFEVSVYYKTFSNILIVRCITAEHLIAMKLMSGRRYKKDLSDIIGILLEHDKNSNPITFDKIDKAVNTLYGDWSEIPEYSKKFINAVFESHDYGKLFEKYRTSERASFKVLKGIDEKYPGLLKADNIDAILENRTNKNIDIDHDER